MRYFKLNYTTSEGEEKEVNLRLTSQNCEEIEKSYNCTLLEYVQQGSITSLVTLLKYMRTETTFTKNMAFDFYDELIDAGYTIESILMDIIYEVLVVSGIISNEDLVNIKGEKEKVQNMTDEEKEEYVAKRKNLKK